MTIPISKEMVQSFEIINNCRHETPCFHQVKIIFNDNKEKVLILPGPEIYAIGKSLPVEKVKNFGRHLDIYGKVQVILNELLTSIYNC